jgi:hypothetical protein
MSETFFAERKRTAIYKHIHTHTHTQHTHTHSDGARVCKALSKINVGSHNLY